MCRASDTKKRFAGFCAIALTARYIRKVLGKDPEPFELIQDVGRYRRTMRRIVREGA